MSTELIYEVTKVQVHIHKTNPPEFHVTANGNANSGSQSNARLERRIYVDFPQDGIQEYDFYIDVPEGPTTDDIKEHTVSDTLVSFPDELKGARVYAKKNKIEEKL